MKGIISSSSSLSSEAHLGDPQTAQKDGRLEDGLFDGGAGYDCSNSRCQVQTQELYKPITMCGISSEASASATTKGMLHCFGCLREQNPLSVCNSCAGKEGAGPWFDHRFAVCVCHPQGVQLFELCA